MKLLRACYDWRILTALGVLGIGVYLVAPDLAAGAIPLLVLAACPISMLLMMKVMSEQQKSPEVQPEPIDGEASDASDATATASNRQEGSSSGPRGAGQITGL